MGLLQLTGALVFFDGGGDRRREARPLVVREGSRGVVVFFFCFSGSFVLFGLDSCPCILYVRICTRMFSLPSNTDTYYQKKSRDTHTLEGRGNDGAMSNVGTVRASVWARGLLLRRFVRTYMYNCDTTPLLLVLAPATIAAPPSS